MSAAEVQDFVPPVGARLQVHQPSGKWAEAAVVAPDGSHAPPGLPHCLHYRDSLEWVRFVSPGVLEGWARPPGKKGAASAAAGPPSGAVAVRPFVVLPEGASTKGRPRREVKEAMDAAVEAAELYRQQHDGGGRGSSHADGTSPAKRRRLSGAVGGSRATNGSAAGHQREQSTSPGVKTAEATPQEQADEGGVPSGQHSEPAAAPSTGMKRRRPGGKPQSPLPDQQQQRQQQQQHDAAEGEQQPAAGGQPAGLQATEVQATQQHASQPVSQPVAEQPMADGSQPEPAAEAKQLPKPSAVTELGLGLAMLAPLATVPVGDDDRETGSRQPAASQPGSSGSKQRPSSQREQRSAQQRQHQGEGGKQQGASAARGDGALRPQSVQQQQQQQQQARPPSRQQPERPSSQQSQQPQQQPAQAEQPPCQPDEGEAAPQAAVPLAERPGDKACRAFEALLPGLSLMKDKIHEAADAAILAGQLGACKEVVHRVLEHMERAPAADKRLPHFYLLDAILAMARKNGEGRGPGSIVGNIFPRVVGAALSQLVYLMGRSLESAQKMEKTLSGTWSAEGKRGVELSLVQHALEELRRTIARHQSAWEDGSGMGASAADAPASVHAGVPGSGGQHSRRPSSGLTLMDEEGPRRMLRKTGMRNALCISFVNIKDGSKVQLMRRWQPEVWPDYSRLPLPPGAEEQQFSYQVALAASAAQAAEAAGAPQPEGDVSPWYDTYDPQYWAAQGFPLEPLRPAQAAAAAAAAASQRMAAAAALMAQQRLMQQQLRARGQSTAAAAEADEFDAGLFKEAAGGIAAPAGDLQLPLLPGLLQPLGGQPFGAPPLPDQPPLPDGDWDYDEDFGPPPLPPHSPPRDEYEMDTDGDSPPPLPPGEEDGAPPPLPPGQQQQQQQPQPADAAPPAWAGGYVAQAGHATAGGQAGRWPGAPPQGAATPAPVPDVPPGFLPPAPAPQQATPLLPPGIGAQPAATAAQQQHAPWLMAQQQQQQQQQAAWMAQQQQAAAMMGMPPAALVAMQGQAPMMFSPAMAQMMNPAMLPQQAAAAAAAMRGMGAQQLGCTPSRPPGPRPPPG